MKQHLLTKILIFILTSTWILPSQVYSLRSESTLQSSGLEELEKNLTSRSNRYNPIPESPRVQRHLPTTGLEETPDVIAIDGVSASGKSAVAAGVAKRVQGVYLSLGTLYRSIAWLSLRNDLDPRRPRDQEELVSQTQNVRLQWNGKKMEVLYSQNHGSSDIVIPEGELHDASVTSRVVDVAPWIHETMIDLARRTLQNLTREGHSVVIDGRIASTVIAPDADVRVFLDAKLPIRAQRRVMQLGLDVQEDIEAKISERDDRDEKHIPQPILPVTPAEKIDTSYLTISQIADRILAQLAETKKHYALGLEREVAALIDRLEVHGRTATGDTLPADIQDEILRVFPELRQTTTTGDPNRLDHIFRVIHRFSQIVTSNNTDLYNSLPDQTKGKPGAYANQLGFLSARYQSLDRPKQQALWLTVILHDIGVAKAVVMHEEHGVPLVGPLLRRANLPPKLIPLVKEVVGNHVQIGMLALGEGTPYRFLKNRLEAVPNDQRKDFMVLLLLMNASDLAGWPRDGRNGLTPYWLEWFLKFSNLDTLEHQITDPAPGYASYRLNQLGRSDPQMPLSFEQNTRLDQAIQDLIPLEEQASFREALNRTIEISNLYISLPSIVDSDPSYHNFVKLLRLYFHVSYLTQSTPLNGEPITAFEFALYGSPLDAAARKDAIQRLAAFLSHIDDKVTLEDARRELQESNWSSFFGIPLTLKPGKLFIDPQLVLYLSELEQIRLQYGNSHGYPEHLMWQIEEAAMDFTGQPGLVESTSRTTRERAQRAQQILRWIYEEPATRDKFKEFLSSYAVGHTFRNRITPAALTIANYLVGRPPDDRRIVEELPPRLLDGNETVGQHPWFGRDARALPLQEALPRPANLISAGGPIRILVVGAAEKVEFTNSGLRYLKALLEHVPALSGRTIEIVGNDIQFQETIHLFDGRGNYLGENPGLTFDAQGRYIDSQTGINLIKLNPTGLEEPAKPANKDGYDVVLVSRVAVQYQDNLLEITRLREEAMRQIVPGGLLLFDTETTDHLELNQQGAAHPLPVTVPYLDIWAAERRVTKITKDPLWRERIEKAFRLAEAFSDWDHPITEKYSAALKLVEQGGHPNQVIATLLWGIPLQAVIETFGPTHTGEQVNVPQMVSTLRKEDWRRPASTIVLDELDINRADRSQLRRRAERLAVVIGAGGAGRRFDEGLLPEYKKLLDDIGRRTKPTAWLGGGKSSIIRTLESLSQFAAELGVPLDVVIATSSDTHTQIDRDLKDNSSLVDRRVIRLSVQDVEEWPTYNQSDGKNLRTWNKQTGRDEVHTRAGGTYTLFTAGERGLKSMGRPVEDRDTLLLYGDDPTLNTRDFLYRVLMASEGVDLLAVATEKTPGVQKNNPRLPPMGTLAEARMPDGRWRLTILEKSHRGNDVGQTGFEQAEMETPGFYPGNTGVLYVSAHARKTVQGVSLNLLSGKSADIQQPDKEKPDEVVVQQFEQYATDVVAAVAAVPENTVMIGIVPFDQYSATKRYAASPEEMSIAEADQRMFQESRSRLIKMLDGRVHVAEESYIDLGRQFQGLQGSGNLTVKGNIVVMFEPNGIFVRRMNKIDQAGHPIFSEEMGQVPGIEINPNGTLTINRPVVIDESMIAIPPDTSSVPLAVIPRPTYAELEAWSQGIPRLPRFLEGLYGWVVQLPAEKRKPVLQTAARAYEVFGERLEQLAQNLPSVRRAHLKDTRRENSSWIAQESQEIQQGFIDLVRAQFPGMSVFGEDLELDVPNSEYHLFVRSPDGRRVLRLLPTDPGGDHYLIMVTIFYRDHPILTIAIAPEYLFPPEIKVPLGVRLVAGLGVNGVLMNRILLTAPARPLSDVVGGMGLLDETWRLNGRYLRTLRESGIHFRAYDDGMALFEIIPSVLFPQLPGTYLAGDQPLEQAVHPDFLVSALGGRLTTLDGNPFILTEQMLARPRQVRAPPRLFAVSPIAHQQLLTELLKRGEEEARSAEDWLRSAEAHFFLLPRPGSIDPAVPFEKLARQKAEAIADQYGRFGWMGKYAEGFSGPDLAGHAEFADAVAIQLREVLKERGHSDVNVIRFSENWFVRAHQERALWMAQTPPHPWAFNHMQWIQWKKLRNALTKIWSVAAPSELLLTGLYNRENRKSNNEVKLDAGPNMIVLVDGTYPMDQRLYPRSRRNPRFLNVHTLVGVTTRVSFERYLKTSGSDPADIQQLFVAIYYPRWQSLLERTEATRRARLIIDMDDIHFPKVLHYKSPVKQEIGLEEAKINRAAVDAYLGKPDVSQVLSASGSLLLGPVEARELSGLEGVKGGLIFSSEETEEVGRGSLFWAADTLPETLSSGARRGIPWLSVKLGGLEELKGVIQRAKVGDVILVEEGTGITVEDAQQVVHEVYGDQVGPRVVFVTSRLLGQMSDGALQNLTLTGLPAVMSLEVSAGLEENRDRAKGILLWT